MRRFSQSRFFRFMLGVGLLLALILAALLVVRQIRGEPLGLRSFVRDQIYLAYSLGRTLAGQEQVRASTIEDYSNIFFLHHSVGSGFIDEGGLRDLLRQKGYALWDQGYSYEGLRGPDGTPLGYTYNIPENNTDPDGYSMLFRQPAYDLPLNGLSQMLQHEVILFKSCFPINDIADDAQAEAIRQYYLAVRQGIDQHPDRLFVLLTTPPLNPAETDTDNAARARALAGWLASDEYRGGRENLVVFDLFDVLAEPDLSRPDGNMLRADFREGDNSHPTPYASRVVAQHLTDFLDQQIVAYRLAFQMAR